MINCRDRKHQGKKEILGIGGYKGEMKKKWLRREEMKRKRG